MESYGLPMKCFNCACQCSGDCDHECTYHLIEGCLKPKKRKKEESMKESIVQSNMFLQSDQDRIPLWFAHNMFHLFQLLGWNTSSIFSRIECTQLLFHVLCSNRKELKSTLDIHMMLYTNYTWMSFKLFNAFRYNRVRDTHRIEQEFVFSDAQCLI